MEGGFLSAQRPRLADLDEATLVARAQDGDLDAFEVLVDIYQTPLFRYAVRTVRDRHLAEDVIQESLLAAWRKLPTLSDPSALKAWLYQIVTFRCLDALRRRQSAPSLVDGLDWLAEEKQTGHDPAAEFEHRERLQALQQVLAELPVELRLCWVLKELQGLSYDEIATALNVPVSTVRGRLARSRQQISERMVSWR